MSMPEFITFDDVRAALGVSEDEITDTTLSLDVYEFNLVSELEGISLLLIPAYLALSEAGPTSWTDIQKRFYQATRLFAAYAVAKQATIAVPMFSPKEQTDGKAGLVRFAQDPYKGMIARVLAQYEIFKIKLEVAYAATTATTATPLTIRSYMSVVGIGVDPVTGV